MREARIIRTSPITRARKTLTLARCGDSNPFLRLLRSHPSVLVRQEPARIPAAPVEMRQAYHRLSLRDVQLSFAGYRPPDHPVHRAIAGLSAGAPPACQNRPDPMGACHCRRGDGGEAGAGIYPSCRNRRGIGDHTGRRLLGQDQIRGRIPGPAEECPLGGGDTGDSRTNDQPIVR